MPQTEEVPDGRALKEGESLEPFQPAHVWVERIIWRQATGQLGSASIGGAEQGRVVREHISQALTVTEEAEQTF